MSSDTLWLVALMLIGIGVIVLLAWGLWRVLFPAKGKPLVCTTCGHHASPKAATRGSFLIELVLWLMFLVPGLIYSLWRLSTRQQQCAACGSTALVPPDTPAGRKLLRENAAGS